MHGLLMMNKQTISDDEKLNRNQFNRCKRQVKSIGLDNDLE